MPVERGTRAPAVLGGKRGLLRRLVRPSRPPSADRSRARFVERRRTEDLHRPLRSAALRSARWRVGRSRKRPFCGRLADFAPTHSAYVFAPAPHSARARFAPAVRTELPFAWKRPRAS